MGILFSRPGHDSFPDSAYAAGDMASLNSSAIAPYLGDNTAIYDNIPTSDLPPIPFEWIVSPSKIDGTCPDGSQVLTMFAVTEAVIAVFLPLVAYRPFIHFLSRGWLGRRAKRSVLLNWTIIFACQLVANATVAGIIGNTPGYDRLNMLHVFTVFMARPRFHLAILGVLRSVIGVKRPQKMEKTRIIDKKVDNRIEFPYTDAYITTAFSEMLTLLITAMFTGVTWHRMPKVSKPRDFMDELVSFVSSTPGIMLLCIVAFVPVWKRYGDSFPIEGRRYDMGRRWGVTVSSDGQATIRVQNTRRKRATAKRASGAIAAAILMGYVTVVQFSYWTRFLQMPGVLFCPPKMLQCGVVWVVFTVVGTLAGAAC